MLAKVSNWRLIVMSVFGHLIFIA